MMSYMPPLIWSSMSLFSSTAWSPDPPGPPDIHVSIFIALAYMCTNSPGFNSTDPRRSPVALALMTASRAFPTEGSW